MDSPNNNKSKDNEIPDDELETPRPRSPILTQLSQNNNDSVNNNPHPAHRAPCPPHMMGWSQIERGDVVARPFPAGMYGIPPYAYMPQMPAANNQNQNSGDKGEPKQVPAKKKRATKKKKGSKDEDDDEKKDMRFTEAEKLELMSILDQIIPVSQVDWEAVEHDFNEFFPERPRTMSALRRFFNTCVKKKSPTGNPNIPAWIRQAKNIQEQIIQKSDAVAFDVDADEDNDPEGLIQLMNRRPNAELDEHSACALQVRHEETDASGKKTVRVTTKPAPTNADAFVAKAKKKAPANTESSDILKAILMSDKLNREAAERRQQEQLEREKKQEKKERRREKKENKRLDIMLGFMTGVMAQYHKKSGGKNLIGEVQLGESTDSDSSNDGGGKSNRRSFNERKRRQNDSDSDDDK